MNITNGNSTSPATAWGVEENSWIKIVIHVKPKPIPSGLQQYIYSPMNSVHWEQLKTKY